VQLRTPAAAPHEPAENGSDLVVRVQSGDEAAFAELYGALHPRLLRYATSLVGQDAEDVTAEAWLQIARDVRRFQGDDDALRGWCARIVRNRALDHWRSVARRPARPVPLEDLLDRAAPDDTAASALEGMGTSAAVHLIATLPRDQAEAVMLRAVVGLDAATAGAVLGKSAAAVRVSAHRGLKSLAKRVDRP
jgi:RNA polymerase sigma-70 factor (ECF subfamily)